MSETPPAKKRRRRYSFWVTVVLATSGVLYLLSFGPACWLDSRRNPELKSTTVSKPLNIFYHPLIEAVHRLDNENGDLILRYAQLFAADGRQAQVVVLGPPGARTGTAWLVWFRRDLRPGPWLLSTPLPDVEASVSVKPPARESKRAGRLRLTVRQ
jgi:hypothetical protein